MIHYIKGDLFSLIPQNAMIMHSCNCMGNWNSGFAALLTVSHREEYRLYKAYCLYDDLYSRQHVTLGTSLVVNDIVCLLTSVGESDNPDSPDSILKNTRNALKHLTKYIPNKEFHLPKINSGLFKVPWEETEAILNEFTDVTFYVYEGKE